MPESTVRGAMTLAVTLRAMRLSSPALPIGAFAYSQGLEGAVETGLVTDEASSRAWIEGLLGYSLGRLDLPMLSRLWKAADIGDRALLRLLEGRLLAARETSELQAEELRLGKALMKLSDDLGETLHPADGALPRTYLGAFAAAAVASRLPEVLALSSYTYAWLEHQTSAAVRLVPLGQTAGQRILLGCLELVPETVATSMGIGDDEIGGLTPGLAIVSAQHETQYSRLFRS